MAALVLFLHMEKTNIQKSYGTFHKATRPVDG